MRSSLELVTEQFPHLRDRVAGLFESDDVFRELCEDYEECVRAAARTVPTEVIRSEYEALRLRMEFELLRHLQETSRASRAPRAKAQD